MVGPGSPGQSDRPKEEQAREQAGEKQIRVGVDERTMQVSYANAFRTAPTAEEVILDFGLNLANPAREGQAQQPDVLFQVSQRVILNYYTAKRLAITLSQVILRHEEQFGELELDVSKRRTGGT